MNHGSKPEADTVFRAAGNSPVANGVTCATFEDRIHDVLDQRQSPGEDRDLLRHAAHCQECDHVLQEYVSVDDSMKLLKGQLDSLLPSQSQVRRGPWRPLITILATAAAVLLLLGLSGMLKFPGQSTPINESVSVAPGLPADAPGSTPPSAEYSSPEDEDIDSPFQFLPSTTTVVSYITGWRQSSWDIPRADEVQERINDLPPVLRWSNEIPGVRPFRGTLSVTLELLRQTLFGTTQDAEPNLGRYPVWPRLSLS